MSDQTRIDDFCRKFERALKQLGIEGYDDIVAEIRAHLEDGASSGELDARLADLGSPDHYARVFHDELRIEAAYVRANPLQTVSTLIVLSTHRLAAAVGLFFAGTLYIFALAFAVTIIVKLIAPETTGLWIDQSQGIFALGTVLEEDGQPLPDEMLGVFYFPVAAALGLISFLLAGFVGRLALRLMRTRHRRS